MLQDYFLYKSTQFLPENKKIEVYKEIVKKYPKSEYIPDCLVAIFFDFGAKKEYYSAIKVAQIYELKFSGTPQESQILFWAGKYSQKVKRDEDAKQFFDKVIKTFPDSYYAYRASVAFQNTKSSWIFEKKGFKTHRCGTVRLVQIFINQIFFYFYFIVIIKRNILLYCSHNLLHFFVDFF